MSEARAIAREAFSHFAKKEHDEAIRLYRLALDADDRFAIAWNGLSMALSQAGDLDENGTKALNGKYKDSKHWAMKGIILVALGKHWHPAGNEMILDDFILLNEHVNPKRK